MPGAPVGVAWIGAVAALITLYVFDRRIDDAGRPDLTAPWSENAVFLVPIFSCVVVGSGLVVHRPRHPVGWLFLALALVVLGSGIVDSYALYSNVVRPGSLPASEVAAVIGDKAFLFWLLLLALILAFVPTGRLNGRGARLAAIGSVVFATTGFAAGLLSPYDGELSPATPIENPLALDGLAGVVTSVRWATVLGLHVCLIAATAMLFSRFRSGREAIRQQLRWLALASVVLPVLVIGAFLSAVLNQELLLGVMAGGFIAVLPVSVGLAIVQDHLFGIERLISRGLTYSILTAILVACYAALVILLGETLSGIGGGSNMAIAIATLTTSSLAGPARSRLQTAIDRRFNRREFDATSIILRFIRQPSATISIEQAMREALQDDSLTIAYWIDDRGEWVTEDGLPVPVAPDALVVERRGSTIARITFEPSRVERRVLDVLLPEAGAEMENARLRAAITLQLREVRESRSRILTAQLEERHRLERNLHDGAQQRLLAVALQLRASELSQDASRQSEAIDGAVNQLQMAVQELRALANGLHPTALSDGGLAGALEDLASQTPTLSLVEVTRDRFAADIEEAAWFVACEAVANAVKHAKATRVGITAMTNDGQLHLLIEDDGIGGANAAGHGLRGISDRVEALGGVLRISSLPGCGTVVRAELPCKSA